MSVGPTPPNDWSHITADLEEASKKAKTEEELNLKIHDIFQKNKLPNSYVLDKTLLNRWVVIEDNTALPFKEILAVNTLFQRAENLDSKKFQELERKFKLLKDNYPAEFEEIIRSLKDKHGIQSDIRSFKELILNIYLSTSKTTKDILNTASMGEYDIDRLETEFFSQIYKPLVKNKERKDQSGKRVGLRDKSPEIQVKFLEGKSNQIRSVKQQYLKKESFENIFKNSCTWRSDLAYICLDPDSRLFGILRNRYGILGTGFDRLISAFEASKAPPELIEKCEALINEWTNERNERPPFFPRFIDNLSQRTIFGRIDSEQIPLTTLNRLGHDEASFLRISEAYRTFKRQFPGLWHRHSWTHTEAIYIDKCMSHIEDLYQQLLKAKYPDQRLQLIARIHWWGCQACPCARGSAAIMEVICQGLLEGSKLPFRLDPKKPVDIYALTEPDENQFVKDYVSLLQSTELD